MKIFNKKELLNQWLISERKLSSIGFVPTMGALHQGHISLIEQAKNHCDIVVCSIFVNPTQFNDPKDFEKYPITVESDIEMLIDASCDALYLPAIDEIYSDGTQTLEHYDIGYIETVLEGSTRLGHFQGVMQVVNRLLDAVLPDVLFLGQKDFQQCMVLKKLIEIKNSLTKVEVLPIQRETDGLAMSSRNRRLTEFQRAIVPLIYKCLISIEAQQNVKSFEIVQKECFDILERKGLKPDYIVLADAETLTLLDDYDSNRKMIALIATFIGDIRLIDNLILQKN
ncbi:MAG TPA: pantoate--beta-alanine ligase [Edaphocola sp.]|nr:pantoate--beta-alanine ligase [Edaphocola sp.]